jgi:formylglycine-generating enzyme required for sulfatase activity
LDRRDGRASVLTIICVGAYYIGATVLWPGPPAGVTRPGASQVTIEAKNRSEHEAKAKAEVEAEAKRRAEEEAARRDPALSVTPGSGQSFRDRLANGQPCPMCPEMVVAPAGSFTMGSPTRERGRDDGEVQVRVTIARPFAVGKFAVTFAEWDACVADSGCKGYRPNDEGWGGNRRPVINVSWDDAKLFIDWLNAKTGKTYGLSEAEREYVTRAVRRRHSGGGLRSHINRRSTTTRRISLLSFRLQPRSQYYHAAMKN